jgi:hypothetical protein
MKNLQPYITPLLAIVMAIVMGLHYGLAASTGWILAAAYMLFDEVRLRLIEGDMKELTSAHEPNADHRQFAKGLWIMLWSGIALALILVGIMVFAL